MKLDLLAFFQLIENDSYVVIKPSNILPDYDIGSDIDIFCYHPQKMVEKITAFLTTYVDSESTISIVDDSQKVHVDYIVGNKVNFRFDLYKSLPEYKNVNLKLAFFSSAIESAERTIFSNGANSIAVKIPSMADDFILRYVEYHEYYEQRPDKIKHIEYIENKISHDKNELQLALDKLHYYTAFPRPEYRVKTKTEKLKEKLEYYQSLIEKVKHLYKTAGLRSLMLKVLKKLKG